MVFPSSLLKALKRNEYEENKLMEKKKKKAEQTVVCKHMKVKKEMRNEHQFVINKW